MSYKITQQGSYAIVSLDGEVDLDTSPVARKQILDQLGEGRHVLVDLSAVEYIDSSGMASLVEAYKVAKDGKQKFGLVKVSRPAMQVLHLAKLDEVFPLYESASECIDGKS